MHYNVNLLTVLYFEDIYESLVGIPTGWIAGIRFPADFFSTPQRPNRLWGPPSLLSSGYRGHISRG
jgi:hypothetical protein